MTTPAQAQALIGACIRTLREQRGMSQQGLAEASRITYQYLSGVENGKENFSIAVLDAIAAGLKFPLKALVSAAYDHQDALKAPKADSRYFRPQVPLPDGLTIAHLEAAINDAQMMFYRINRNLRLEVGKPLQDFIQGNNFSGLVSNIFSKALNDNSPYKDNHDQRYPDLINKGAHKGKGEGLEVKATINIGKGGESHNGHSGWHTISCYEIDAQGDVRFIHVMFAELNGHQEKDPDWSYLGSKVNSTTGSRRTETYVTNLCGTTKLRDGSVYLDTGKVEIKRWRQERKAKKAPLWSPFPAKTNPKSPKKSK